MLDNIFETFNDPAAEESFGPDSETYRVHAFVAYLIPILFFVPFITNKYSDYCKFHSNQCLAWMIGVLALNIIKTILAHIPVLGNIVINNVKFVHRTFGGFVGGKVLDSIIIGLLCFIGTTIMQMPYASLISVIIGFTNIIPFFGPFLGAIPSILLLFIVDPMHPINCLYFAIFVFILQQFDGNILGPFILGDSTGLSSFWVIFSITLFGGMWGIPGMLIGVPLFAVIYAAIKSRIEMKLKKKDLPVETDEYTYVCAIDDAGLHKYIPEGKQNKKYKDVYQFGQQFISDSSEIVTGDLMTKTTTQKPPVKKKKPSDKTTDDQSQ